MKGARIQVQCVRGGVDHQSDQFRNDRAVLGFDQSALSLQAHFHDGRTQSRHPAGRVAARQVHLGGRLAVAVGDPVYPPVGLVAQGVS